MNEWHLARGYRFAGIVSGLRNEPDRRDLAVVISDGPAGRPECLRRTAFVRPLYRSAENACRAADARAIVICSGNANACTGEQGLADAWRMAELVALELHISPEQVLVASTGIIGRPLPMAILEAGIPKAVRSAAPSCEAFNDAAHAILTTDTRIKVASRGLSLQAGDVMVTGFAKGAAMIGPNLATMLGFILTDAAVNERDLHHILKASCESSFNCVSVEGHTSTNDTVFLLANGSGPPLAGRDLAAFHDAVSGVCMELARQIAMDAEGAQHLITVDVEGCRSDGEARQVAKAVAESALVKTAVFGHDPNWGRIVSAAGYSGIHFEEKDLSLWIGDMLLYRDGTPLPFDAATASAYLKANREVRFRLLFALGTGHCTFHTCDLTYDYVRLNADYTT